MRRVLTVAALAASGVLANSAAFPQEAPPSPAFTPADLAAAPTSMWATNGGNLYNQRYSPLAQINRDNVGQLKAVWRAGLNGSGLGPEFSGQAQPLFYEGVLYVPTGENDVFAIDIESGEIVWEYEANIDPEQVIVCCGRVARGVGMGDGKIFVGQANAHLVALDQATGEVLWDITAEDWSKGYAITSAPLYYDGMVITGYAGGEYGIRGKVEAFDADTGEKIWTFYTIPGPGEFGHETWPQDSDAWMYGGAPVWQTPAVDPELGLLIFTTGNPGPDLSGATRAGDNLFSTSFVAIDIKTGEYRWHFQQVHHDIWDYDAPQPVILFDAMIDGELRKGAAEIGKSGYLYIVDRTNGEPLIGIPETPVPQEPTQATSPTQPIPVGDDIMPHFIDIPPEGWTNIPNEGRTFTPFDEDTPVLWKPSAGANWPPSSYDPESHLMFICANDNIGGGLHEELEDIVPAPPESYMGGVFQRADMPVRGIYSAVDLRTNRIAWRQAWSSRCDNPSAATGGGLVFLGRNDGRMTALNSSTGELLWEFQIDAGINAPPAVFEWKGTQYVAVLAAGTVFARTKKGDGLWLFALNGTMDPLPPGSADPAPAPAPGMPGLEAEAPQVPEREADSANGGTLFAAGCTPCHGADGKGGHEGGVPLYNDLMVDRVFAQVTLGSGDMPPFGAVYTPEQIHDIAAHVVDLVADNERPAQ